MTNCWRDLSPGPDPPRLVHAIIEVPKGSINKYEYDCKTGFFKLDRVLYSSLHFPTDYGLIPETYCSDGDPLDILALTTEPTFTGCVMVVRPVGLLKTIDEAGEDEKIIGVSSGDPRFKEVIDIKHVGGHFLLEIEDFFQNYKNLEPGKWVKVQGWRDKKAAEETILSAIRLYKEMFENQSERICQVHKMATPVSEDLTFSSSKNVELK